VDLEVDTGGGFSAPAVVTRTGMTCDAPAAAADGAGAVAVFDCGALQSARWDGAAWSAPVWIGPAVGPITLTAGGAGPIALHAASTGTYPAVTTSLSRLSILGAQASPSELVSAREAGFGAAFDGSSHVAAWAEWDPAFSVYRVTYRRGP
jgi:hypothetical protein